MKPKKQKPRVRVLMPGPPRKNVMGTVARLTKEELEKHAGTRPLFRPPPRGKKSA
jgi:hypothetical protein